MRIRRGRVLVSKLGLDGHDVGAKVVAHALRDQGFEVVYLGIRQTPQVVAATARDEDVDVVGVSILSGAHLSLVPRLLELLDAEDVTAPVVLGGVIPEADRAALLKAGVTAIVDGRTSLADMAGTVARLVETARGGAA